MMSSRKPGPLWCRLIATIVVLTPTAGLLAMAAAPAATAKAGPGKPEAKKSPAPASKAKAKVQAPPKLPERPKKVVKTPLLTPEGLDDLVKQYLATAKVATVKRTSDIEYVRRVYLDLTGKLPKPDQVRQFVYSSARDKRTRLIDQLLRSPDYAENWAHYWRDVIRFRATASNTNQVRYEDMEDWLVEKFSKNAPWDEIARGIIVATGNNDDNGAVNFALAHEVQAVEIAGEVSRIFMGVQIQCAQCHDHPTDSWKQQQFHEFAAYFAGMRRKEVVKAMPGMKAITEVSAPGKPRYTMPDKKDPSKRIFVAPKFFLDPKQEVLAPNFESIERLGLVADYVTGQDNPWFAKAFVNRIWYLMLGEAFYSPVDDIGPDRTAKAPEVLEALSTEFRNSGYNIHWLLKTILSSDTYQRQVRSTYTDTGRTPFAAVSPSRLRGDQILDSLSQILRFPVDPRPADTNAKAKDAATDKAAVSSKAMAKDLKNTVGKKKGRGPQRTRDQFNTIFAIDPSTPNEDVLGTIPQSLYLMNSPQLHNAMRGSGASMLGEVLAANPKNNRAALGEIYLRVLSREPTAKEVQVCGAYIEKVKNRREAFEDILWSLINSTEFITRR